jgi:hypothetical protein
VGVDLPQVEVVALVQTGVVVHIPVDKRKKSEWKNMRENFAYAHSAVCCVLSLCLMKLHLLLLKLCLYFGVLLPNDNQ